MLISVLNHACKVIKAGRSLLRRLIDLSKVVKYLVRLNRQARSDLEWWHLFASSWNGVSMMFNANMLQCELSMVSDASGNWGCGVFSGDKWFQLKWPAEMQNCHITVKEMVPIVLAARMWGKQWSRKNIMAYCDNEAVVAIINKGNSWEVECIHLMRCLAFFRAKFHFTLYTQHISGSLNDLADALSRDRLQYFMANHPQALSRSTALPPELLNLTIIRKPDWMSQTWIKLWKATFVQD